MQKTLSNVRWFFTGIRMFLPLVPRFLWIAAEKVYESTVDYWKDSQAIVDDISYNYIRDATGEITSEYDKYVIWTCYGLAAFLYLLGWLGMAWFTMWLLQQLLGLLHRLLPWLF